MCRLYGFRSSVASRVHRSLVAAENALAQQSERHADGWGLAYYVSRYPHLIRNAQQALSDELFRELSGVVATHTFLAHIRRATVGRVHILNCHPFQHGVWTFAHNGEISGYNANEAIRAKVNKAIDERFKPHILGNTDSETIFYIFLSYLARQVDDIHNIGVTTAHALYALKQTVDTIKQITEKHYAEEINQLTFIITNGSILIGYRDNKELYYSTYKKSCSEKQTCPAYEGNRCEAAVSDGLVKHLIISSEIIGGTANVWVPIEQSDYVCVDHGMYFRTGTL